MEQLDARVDVLTDAHGTKTSITHAVFVSLRGGPPFSVCHCETRRLRERWTEAGMNDKVDLPFDPEAFLAGAGRGTIKSVYEEDQAIFSQGEAADSILYVNIGKVKLSLLSKQGREAVVAILGPGDFLGEGCLAGQPLRMVTAVAMTKCSITRLDKAAMIRLLHDTPTFSERFMLHLLARNIRVEADLVDQLFNSTERRLARLLLILANFGKEGKPEPVIARVSQKLLAEMIGTTRPRVSSLMNKFRKLGYIDYNGHLEVHSSLLNVVLYVNTGADDG